jgi:hypothetical protein
MEEGYRSTLLHLGGTRPRIGEGGQCRGVSLLLGSTLGAPGAPLSACMTDTCLPQAWEEQERGEGLDSALGLCWA